jgi:hypothetical protein
MLDTKNLKETHSRRAAGLLAEIDNIPHTVANGAETMIALSTASIAHSLLALFWQNEENHNIEYSKTPRLRAKMENLDTNQSRQDKPKDLDYHD